MKHRWISIVTGLFALAPFVTADNHKWEIREVFSSADESVQFIELFNQDKDEQNLSLTSLTTASGSFFAFPANLPSAVTENRHVLIATAAFAAIPGAPTPDYVIPAGFLERTGDTVTYQASPSSVSFGALPSDGFRSIDAAGVQATNSPTNFAGQTGSLVLATSAVRNGSGQNTLCYTATPPALGKPWSAVIDTSAHPGATLGAIVGHTQAGGGIFIPYGELLVTGPVVFQLFKPVSAGQALFAAQMPVNMALFGLSVTSQGVILGGGPELVNAVDMKMGW